MKLLRLTIETEGGFRSLPQGFEIKFHTQEEGMGYFRPFCFAGLNGSGKSNVLEALAAIFYHLEFCVAKYLPETIKNPDNFKRTKCTLDSFTLEFLIGPTDERPQVISNFNKVVITKKEGEEPAFRVYAFPFTDDKIIIPNPDTKEEDKRNGIVTEQGKIFERHDKVWLPDNVVGYSSGENEILSLPFIKCKLVRLDEYKQATKANAQSYDVELDERRARNSLIYIDSKMSQAVLLACLLFENEQTLAPIRDVENTGIVDLKSFRMTIRLHQFTFQKEGENVLQLIEQEQINKLKQCATTWFSDGKILYLDFFVTQATKDAFRHHFNNNAFEAFQLFRLLYELNAHFIDEKNVEKVYQSQGVYTDWKIPEGLPDQDVFHFEDFYLVKQLKGSGKKIDLLLRNLSDGEHQFLHTMCICLLLKERRALLLLDEPETHFNPSWRARFIKILNDSIEASNKGERPNGRFNIHLLKDVLLTSHSPFIISDCLPDNVILFERDKEGKVYIITAKEKGFNTYGASVDLVLQEIFQMSYSISEHAREEIRILLRKRTPQAIIEGATKFGESYEKGFLYERIQELNNKKKR